MNETTAILKPGLHSDNLRKSWTLPFLAIVSAHFVMDAFSGMIPASLGLIQARWTMTDQQGAWFLGIGSLCSGLAQPFFAWLSDRTGNRVFGGLGLCIAAVLISSIGLAANALYLFAFYAFGMIGNGMFHPIAASTIGQLTPRRRSLAVSCFFVAGMLGGITGATLGPRLLVTPDGFEWLRLAAIPACLVAVFLHFGIRKVEHRVIVTDDQGKRVPPPSQWGAVALLYCSAAIRFLVNLALVYLYVRLMESAVTARSPDLDSEEISKLAAPLTGNINAASFMGMAVGGLVSGLLIPGGREKWPYVFLPLACAPLVALLPFANTTTACFLAFGAGFGFASLVPVTIAMAQRFMPGRTSLASGLMMGGAWAVAMFGPVLAEALITRLGMDNAFFVIAGLMAVSGMFILPIKSKTISGSVEPYTNRGRS